MYLPYLAKRAADTVKCDGVDTRVDEGETKSRDSAGVPKVVKSIFCLWVEVEPKEEQVRGEKAQGKNQHKG